ncbi:DUF3426 domain-containing protein [Marinobacter halodurans]|uniref:DUF3426 domain-containing protein n=1 Tax=Marinobacter halodurans TaxID=2528979 RepID=A0ABY1ZS26_9GAMM|nr:DUF3426 domain-containing protein [Marinobacter halodurans]TBW58504.1 DUF3426 domain-containing protein [Marinobacter halodurans]
MSQSSTLTRCPHCDTRFRVTEEQLGIARGKVRCGNCMEVFNALEHSETAASKPRPSTPPSPAPKSAPEEPPADASSRFMEEEELIFEDDPEEDAAEGNYAGTKTTFDEDELSDSFLNFDETRDSGFGDDEDEVKTDVDESWAEAILDESESMTRKAPKPSPPEPHKPEPTPEPPSDDDDLLDDAFSQRTVFKAPPSEPERPQRRPEPEPETESFGPATDTPHATHQQPAQPEPDAIRPERDEPLAATRRLGSSSPFQNLRHDPIAIGKPRRSWLRRSIWTLLVLVLLGVLVSQVTYFQLDRLSSIPELRPYYEQGCEILGCELPPLVAIDRIQSQKLVVRTDPDQRGTLVVDAVLVNEAGFEQPFPNIGLTFSNLNGDVVAQSLFEPDEYLSGEAQDLSMMPSQTPIRISIHIRDPGRDAVNYNITFIARSTQ